MQADARMEEPTLDLSPPEDGDTLYGELERRSTAEGRKKTEMAWTSEWYSTILRTKHYMLNLQNMLTAEKPTLYMLLQESKNSELIQRRNIEFYYERQ